MSVPLIEIEEKTILPEIESPPQRSSVWRLIWRNPLGALSMIMLGLMIAGAIVLPMIIPYHWDQQTSDYFAPPSSHHWLGTDDTGYDILVRLACGTRISLEVGIGVELIDLTLGIVIGLAAGYYGKWADTVLMRFTDMMFAFPDILLAILIMAVLGQGFGNIFAALAVTGWASLARLVRGQTLTLKRREYVEAARAIGVGDFAIMTQHIFPNLVSSVVVASTVDIASVIIGEATLSFLGLGLPYPVPSLGTMIAWPLNSGYFQGHPSLVVYPAICLSVIVLSFNFLGDALRDALDPRTRRSV